jgi:hypothetical protein
VLGRSPQALVSLFEQTDRGSSAAAALAPPPIDNIWMELDNPGEVTPRRVRHVSLSPGA